MSVTRRLIKITTNMMITTAKYIFITFPVKQFDFSKNTSFYFKPVVNLSISRITRHTHTAVIKRRSKNINTLVYGNDPLRQRRDYRVLHGTHPAILWTGTNDGVRQQRSIFNLMSCRVELCAARFHVRGFWPARRCGKLHSING